MECEECRRNYRDKKKFYMCFVDIEKAFDKVPRKVIEWAMRKKFTRSNFNSSDEPLSWSKNKS